MILSNKRQIIIPLIFAKKFDSAVDLHRITGIGQKCIQKTIEALEEIELITTVIDPKDTRIKRIVILEANANTILCKLFGYDLDDPFKILDDKE